MTVLGEHVFLTDMENRQQYNYGQLLSPIGQTEISLLGKTGVAFTMKQGLRWHDVWNEVCL